MATVEISRESRKSPGDRIPPLRNGDQLTRGEFERRYAAMPESTRAELIEGVVYMPSPVRDEHSGGHFDFSGWLWFYAVHTPGVKGGDNGTLRLDLDNEPQPDSFLRVLESCGGQSHIDEDGYIAKAPELIGEIALSSVSIDLHGKFQVYRRNGVIEYVVWRVEDREIDWFVLRDGGYERLQPKVDGIYQSEVFPGLWLDAAALVRGEMMTVMQTLQQGLATPEHATFVERLRQAAAKLQRR
jgi:hypothetical protein